MNLKSESPVGTKVVYCPQCEYPLPGDARACPGCGLDLTLLSLLAEKAYLEGFPDTAPIASTPESLVPRIGEYLLEQGLLSQEDLEAALSHQQALASQGEKLLLGQTLVKLGYVDREILDRAITKQIIELHSALQESNRTLERRVEERTAELRRALERLTEINQIKANLISNISHELRTPLAHVKGYVELLIDNQLGEVEPEQLKALSVVRRGTERLENLIEELIEFSTASREGLNLHLEEVAIHEIIEGVLKRSEEKATKAGVELASKVDDGLPSLNVDAQRLSWVLYQLVDNGIKFTPSGGKVSVIAELRNGRILLNVHDTGIGIPNDRMQEMFEPFHQLDGSPTRRYGGTGLGLSLVKLILDAHGAELQVESEEGKGSNFSFPLPVNLRQ